MEKEKSINKVPIDIVFQLEEIGKEIRRILQIQPDEIIDMWNFISKIKDTFKDFLIFEKSNNNFLYARDGKIIIAYDYFSKESSKYTSEFIMNSICYTILNLDRINDNFKLNESSIIFNKEAECLCNAILFPEKLYVHEMISTSRCDGRVNIEEMAKKFKVKEYSIISRCRDLRIWN